MLRIVSPSIDEEMASVFCCQIYTSRLSIASLNDSVEGVLEVWRTFHGQGSAKIFYSYQLHVKIFFYEPQIDMFVRPCTREWPNFIANKSSSPPSDDRFKGKKYPDSATASQRVAGPIATNP